MGAMPLAGDFNAGRNAKLHPLAIDYCIACDVLQVRELPPHEEIFNAHYCYASSTVPALVEHFKQHAQYIKQFLPPNGWVLEIGSNDGVLLRALDELHIENIGLDASANVVEMAVKQGCAAATCSFSKETASVALKYRAQQYDVVTCSNMFAHNPDPGDILEGVKKVLKKGGHLIIEVHDADELYSKLQWDCFYHEHCFYWSIYSLDALLTRHGFTVVAHDTTKMHGGCLRVAARYGPMTCQVVCGSPQKDRWQGFGTAAEKSAVRLYEVIGGLSAISKERKINLLGAAGRATTLVNFSEIGSFISCAFDGSSLRIGKEIPGTEIKIQNEEELENKDQFIVFGAWHLESDLLQKFAKRIPAASFITPLPYVKIF